MSLSKWTALPNTAPLTYSLMSAGLSHMRFHDLRHSAATILLSIDVNPKVIQELLGHSQISMTLGTYSHVLPSMQRDAVDKWKDLLEGSKEGETEGNEDKRVEQ